MQRSFLFLLACGGWLAQLPAVQAQNPAATPTATSTRSLGLAEAVQLALATSKDLKRNQAAQAQATARLQQAIDGVVPSVQVAATFQRISDNITPFTIQLPGAGEVVLNPQVLNQSFNSLQVRQLVWAGGKVRLGQLAARHELEATQAEAGQYQLAAADNATSLWYNLYTLAGAEQIIRQNSQLLRERRRDLTNLERQGLVLKNDGLKVDLALSQLESSLADVRAGRAINAFNLATATGLPTTTPLLVDSAALAAPPALGPLAEYAQAALANRPEVKALGLRREAAVVGQRIVRAGTLPTLAVGGIVDYNRPNFREFPLRPAFKATSAVFANVSWDLGSLYTNRAKMAESRAGLEQLSTGLDQLRDGVQIEVNASYQACAQAREKVRVAEQAVAQATENFRVEQNRFRASVSTATDFLAANTQLVQARLDLRTAQANTELAYWKLLKSTGRLAAQ